MKPAFTDRISISVLLVEGTKEMEWSNAFTLQKKRLKVKTGYVTSMEIPHRSAAEPDLEHRSFRS
jgi:hypothetical protein